ncbi:TrgA family protein [Roseovarius sp. 2305UL8-3]|uniref:TrgA family protein n=1 Tax=Roseovarius conchicola TaxID=3121636 RepID=UPI0035296F1C
MPTSAKMVAAVGLAIVGWFGSEAIRPLLPEQTQFGWFNQVNVALGLICGWRVTGKRVQGGLTEALSGGLTGAAALTFWGLFAQSFNLMLADALAGRHGGPFEGLIAVFYNAVDYGQYLLDAKVIGIIVGGGILTGLIANRFTPR